MQYLFSTDQIRNDLLRVPRAGFKGMMLPWLPALRHLPICSIIDFMNQV